MNSEDSALDTSMEESKSGALSDVLSLK